MTWSERRHSDTAFSSRATTTPPIASQWPERYLVVECITRSTPSASGRCRNGVAHVLSHAVNTCDDLASATMPCRSVIAMVGFEGVSNHKSRVVGRSDSCTARRFVMSTNVTSNPRVRR